MQKKAKLFFILLMIVFIVGVLIHLIIPLEIVVNGTQKIQQAYNGYKIQVQQNMVRATSYLNSLAISNHIQMYENVRSTVIKLFDNGDRYLVIDVSKVQINNAYELTQKNTSQVTPQEMSHSMWFTTGISTVQDMNPALQWMYALFAQIQKYLDSVNMNDNFNQGLEAIQFTINYQGNQIYFQYPSSIKQKFSDLNASVLGNQYYNTVLNYKTQLRYQTIFNQLQSIKACSPILDGTEAFAVVCLKLNAQTVTRKITNSLKVPNFQLSSSRYYLIRPIYKYEGLEYPQIISYFNSDDLNYVKIPDKQYFTQKINDGKNLLSAKQNYLLNVQQQKTKTYYTIPIETYNNIDTKQIIMFLIVINDFAKSELKSASHYKEIFVALIIPCSILLIIAALTMGFVMRPLFNKLHQYSTLMNQYCHFIKKNDMTLQITEIGETSDFVEIFKKLKHLNLLNKLATPSYLKVVDQQRIIKLLRGLQLFDKLGYSKVNIYQNLAECYHRTGQLENALKFLKLSVDTTIFDLGKIQGIQKMIKQQGDTKRKRKSMDKRQRQKPSIKHLRYQIFRLCLLLYQMGSQGDNFIKQQLKKNVQILKKLHYRSNISFQYVYCYLIEAICSLGSQQEIMTQHKIDMANQMIKKLEQSSSKNSKLIPIQILKSYRFYLKGKLLKRQGKLYEGYQSFMLALDGYRFDPDIHAKIRSEIMEIMDYCQIQNREIDNIFNYLNTEEELKQQKQFIFLSDVSNPRLSIEQFNSWKLLARKMGEYIFDNHIKPKDRIGISQFCNDLKVICNLIEKGINQTILKKQLMSSIKARDQKIFSQLIPNLKKTIDRTKNLVRQKIFIVFLKEGNQIDSSQILEQIGNCPNSKFIFLVSKTSQRIINVEEGYYVVSFDGFQDIDLILGSKVIKRADNLIYLF